MTKFPILLLSLALENEYSIFFKEINMIENEYKYRINKVIDYIEKNIQDEFSLDDLARVSNFSKFHFSRIFRGITGETPFQFILRLRLEKAASFLIHNPDTISDIAYKCGFKSLPVFSKNFKLHFGESASSYRKKNKNSNFNKVDSFSDKKFEWIDEQTLALIYYKTKPEKGTMVFDCKTKERQIIWKSDNEFEIKLPDNKKELFYSDESHHLYFKRSPTDFSKRKE